MKYSNKKNYIIFVLLAIVLSSCTRYQWVSVETKITLYGNKIHIEQVGKPIPLSDTTLSGRMIMRSRY